MTLNNVELRTEVLQDELETPLTFKRIFIQELKLNIPWASLRYQPAKVSSHPRGLLGSARSLARQHLPACPRACALWAHATRRRCACDVLPACRSGCATPGWRGWPAATSPLLAMARPTARPT